MAVIPLKDYVLVAENVTDQQSDGGIIISGANSTRNSRTGTILAVGPDVIDVIVGDRILLDWTKAAVVTVDGKQRVIIKEEHIVAEFGK